MGVYTQSTRAASSETMMNQILASFLFCSVLQYQVTEGATFNFIDEPKNVTVEVMGTAIFNCTYNSTRSSFDWLINDTAYSLASRFPRNHYSSSIVNGFSLAVYNVQNTASYGCEIRDSSNIYRSQIGYLCVKETVVTTAMITGMISPSIETSNTDGYENSTVENSTVENSTVENSSVDKKKGAPSEIIIIVGVVSSLVVSTILYCSIILLGISCHRKYFVSKKNCQTAEVKTDELTPPTPIYEEIEDIVLAVGSSKEQVFDMHECGAYTVA